MMKRLLNLFLLIAVMLLSCKKDDPGPQPANPPATGGSSFSDGVFVINEGNFTWGNGSLSFISRQGSAVQNNIFQAVNNRPLGDVPQSMAISGSTAYIVVNNSQKIEIVDRNTLQSRGTITGLTSPRYMQIVSTSKAYVTDLYANRVWVIDLQQNAVVSFIPVSGWTEKMLLYNGKVYVTNTGRSHLMIIDPATDQLVDSILLTRQPAGIVKDSNDKLWVLCSGDLGQAILPALYRIDPASSSVQQLFTFPSASSPHSLAINPAGDSLYYINDGVYKMSVNASSLPFSQHISSAGYLFYNLDVDPVTGVLYVSDAVDYVQQGYVFRFRPGGAKIDSFAVGIIPGSFSFN